MSFVHLHLHTQFSLLQGALRVEDLIARAKEFGMPAVAITDTDNLFGGIEFYNEAKAAGLNAILGAEVTYAAQGRAAIIQAATSAMSGRGGSSAGGMPLTSQLVLLAKSYKGYQSLCQILSRATLDAPPVQKGQPASTIFKSLVDREMLDKYAEDLVVLSGGLKGEIPLKIAFGEEAEAKASLEWFKKRFGEDFYLELEDVGIPEQEAMNETLFEWGKRYGVEVVGTANCHYLEAKDAEAHEILQCIATGRNLSFDRPKSLVPAEFYFKSPELMRERLERYAGAADNTLKIAEKCQLKFKFKDEQGRPIYHLPNFRPDGVTREDAFDAIQFFKDQSREGLAARFEEPGFKVKVSHPDWAEHKKVYEARLEEELTMIERTGFSGYFLIVSDFIKWAKANGIPVGPGRGSGAGSLVAYCLQITDIDPIEFKLLFERFINPERISMPDFDVDFCQDRREEVIEYVNRKYGKDKVSQIITFGKLQTKACIKDVGRVLGLTFAESDIMTKLVPDTLGISIQEAIDQEPQIKQKMESEPRIGKVMEYALALEGLYRNAGVHAAGVIITEEPLVHYTPLYATEKGVVTQFDKDSAEKIGLVKFDFLGLKTLTVIDHAIKFIRQQAEPGSFESEFTTQLINYNDSKVYDLISSGDTDGVFQVESSGMKSLCSRLQPNSVEDLTAINALYRPGPLGSGMVDDFIDRKHGRKPITYDVATLEGILKETYGVIVYQEQVMQIARELAGYSLGQADLLRRAMGKKKAEEMAAQRALFVKGATERGLASAKAEGIFDLMAKFAEYGFNKSHAAAYAVITYQTAYLKTHYPAEFMAALMTTEASDTENITKYIGDARAHEIEVLPPDVNRSQPKFSVEKVDGKKAIRFGLEAIKGVGGAAVEAILAARAEKPFESVVDFVRRVSTRKANKKVLESLTLAGGFDPLIATDEGLNRASLFASLEGLLEFASSEQEERELGQNSLFDSFSGTEVRIPTASSTLFKKEEDWPRAKKLMGEKQVVGFYVSGHPLDPWQKICEEWLGWSIERIKSFAKDKAAQPQKAPAPPMPGPDGQMRYQRAPKVEVKVAGLVISMREVMTKKGSRMAFGEFEDLTGKCELVFFPDAYAQNQELLKRASTEAESVIITADLELGEEVPKLLVKDMQWTEEAHKTRVQQVVLRLPPGDVTPEQMRELKSRLMSFRGRCPVRIDFIDDKFKTRMELPRTLSVKASPQLVTAINEVFGKPVVSLQ